MTISDGMETIRVDGGGPYLWQVGEVAMRSVTTVCDGCDDIHLAISLYPSGQVDVGTPLTKTGTIKLDPWTVDIERSGGLPEDVEDKLVAEFDKFEQELRWRGERLLAARNRELWREADFSGYTAMTLVRYRAVFPADFDLIYTDDDGAYFVEDYHCLVPGCPCKLMGLGLTRMDDRTGGNDELGQVTVDLDEKNGKVEGKKQVVTAIRQLLATTDLRARLLRRHAECRRIAADVSKAWGGETAKSGQPKAPERRGPKVGRNEPCPCGSGKKYKKCCLQ